MEGLGLVFEASFHAMEDNRQKPPLPKQSDQPCRPDVTVKCY